MSFASLFQHPRLKILTLIAPLVLTSYSQAQEQMTPELYEIQHSLSTDTNILLGSPPEAQPNEYFTIEEASAHRSIRGVFSEPMALLQEGFQAVRAMNSPLPLTQWRLHAMAPNLPQEKYNRKGHFGAWVNDPNDNTCYNTRAKVLIRDSRVPVTLKANNHCSVESGLWNDPYTGQQFTSSKDIQIDHVVPLKHAYTTGGFQWDYKTRCHYANFTENNYHLLSVSGHENMSKGDKSPDQYMPPNAQVACSYLQRWLEIKLAWHLVLFPNEAKGIKAYIQKYRCNPDQFIMNTDDLAQQRRAIQQDISSCVRAAANQITE